MHKSPLSLPLSLSLSVSVSVCLSLSLFLNLYTYLYHLNPVIFNPDDTSIISWSLLSVFGSQTSGLTIWLPSQAGAPSHPPGCRLGRRRSRRSRRSTSPILVLRLTRRPSAEPPWSIVRRRVLTKTSATCAR